MNGYLECKHRFITGNGEFNCTRVKGHGGNHYDSRKDQEFVADKTGNRLILKKKKINEVSLV